MTSPSSDSELDSILRDAIYIARHGDKTARTRLDEAKAALLAWNKQRVEETAKDEHRIGYMQGVRDFSNYFMDASLSGQRNPIMPDVARELIESYQPPVVSPLDGTQRYEK